MVPLQSVLLILVAIFSTSNSVELCDEPQLIITSPLDPCYSLYDKIFVQYIAPCVPLNTPLTVRACKAINSTCEDIGTVLSNGKQFTLIILDVCQLGLSYYIELQSCDGVDDLIVRSSVFTVKDSAITITNALEPCYSYKDVIEVYIETECFPPGTHFTISLCCSDNCVPIGCISDEETCVLVSVQEPFVFDQLNYIQIESKEYYNAIIQRTPDFLVTASCRQNPSVTVGPLDDCYQYKETITVQYSSDCIPINCPVIAQICTIKSCVDYQTIPSSGKSFDVTLISPFFEKKGVYRIQIRSKEGTVLGTSNKFEVSEPYIQVTSKCAKCYNEKDIIQIDYEANCFPDDAEKFLVRVCCRRQCVELGRISPKVNSFLVQVLKPVLVPGETCFIIIQTLDGQKSATTDGFFVSIKQCPAY